MEDSKFYALAAQLNKITYQYQLPAGTPGHLKHHQYVVEYDKTLEVNGITKKQFIAEVNRRAKERVKLTK